MDCTQTRNLLHGYLDRELDLASAAAIDRHLQSCASCKAIVDEQSTLQELVRRQATYHRAPAGFAERLRAQIGGETAHSASSRWTWAEWLRPGRWLPVGAAIAATAVLTWTAALQFPAPAAGSVAEQIVAGHARSIVTGHLVDIPSSDKHTVKPWLSSKLDFSPQVTDLAGSGFPLAGGRLDYLEGRPVAALVYHRRQHVINLFVWPESKPSDRAPMAALSKHGYHLLHWSRSGMTYWAISDVDAEDLMTFARQYAGQP